ncbi:cupredoxin domain-containing protein [Silvimonas amylolytica]|uniref:EfeO-type cupredoxin-like domain-containing protein n=1 Tax=Silvimonas amylolytica TaxID=449663 RepID=A0ABQ2PJ78_9NEIS|nr:cupredoxin domain-containing protein [Silvimonas amylolytica]GGP25421.1 hypothetical protein GCM10010971_12400 [Silvimonas amylolytica]
MRKTLFALVLALASLSGVALADDTHEVKIEFKDGKANPTVLNVPAGKKIRVVLTNTGTQAAEFESTQLRKEKVLGPGVTSFVILAPLSPGEYTWFDDFHQATAKGKIIAK